MSRKLIFGYAIIFLGFVVATLAITAPPLVAEPLGFTAVFLPLLGVGLVLHYAFRHRSGLARGIVNGFLTMAAVFAIGAMGAAGWGLFAGFLMLIALVSVKRAPPIIRHGRPVPPAHDVEKAARQSFPWDERKPAKSYSH